MAFTRTKENFICDHCNEEVVGNGYTNHCPKCLWSKHVDNDPGDRAATCDGAMEPLRLEGSTPKYRIVHRCAKCRIERTVNVADNDDPTALVELSRKPSLLP